MDRPRSSFEEYLASVSMALATPENRHLRRGQVYANTLFDFGRGHLENHVLVHLPAADPFYRDENLPAFLAYVAENWGTD